MSIKNKEQLFGMFVVFCAIIFAFTVSAEDIKNKNVTEDEKIIGVTKYVHPQDLSNFSHYTEQMHAFVDNKSEAEIIIGKDGKGKVVKVSQDMMNKAKLAAEKHKKAFKTDLNTKDGNIMVKLPISKSNAKSDAKSTKDSSSLSSGSPIVNIYWVSYYWYWIKDNTYTVSVGICNDGDTTDDYGIVAFWFGDDRQGNYTYYTDLEPNHCRQVNIPFTFNQSMSVGLKPSYVGVIYDHWSQYEIWYLGDHWGPYPYAAVYKDSSLGDPNITLTDSRTTENNEYALSHFPIPIGNGFQHPLDSNQLKTLYEAAIAGDNTLTPGATSNALNTYVYNKMSYNTTFLDSNIRSDIWIRNNNFKGVCKEYASLFNAYSRALRIPSRILVGLDDSDLNKESHAWCENWNGTDWIQYDPTNNIVNNPCYYKNNGYDFRIWWMNEWDDKNDDGDGSDETDSILSMLYCDDWYCQGTVYSDAGLVHDFGYWNKYNSNCG